MSKTVLGIFSNRLDAEAAVDDLQDVGYGADDISIMMLDTSERYSSISDSIVSTTLAGGVIGGVAGLLIGIGAVMVPGIGALLIGGPLAFALGTTSVASTTVTGAVTGVLAGGIIGALMGIGIPEKDAKAYEKHIKKGDILLAIPAEVGQEQELSVLLEDNSAQLIRILDTTLPERPVEEESLVYQERQNVFISHGSKGGQSRKRIPTKKSTYKKKAM